MHVLVDKELGDDDFMTGLISRINLGVLGVEILCKHGSKSSAK